MRSRGFIVPIAIAVMMSLLMATSVAAGGPSSAPAGAVYTQTNDATGNAVLRFERDSSGQLSAPTAFPTGGLGTGAGLGSQGAVVVSQNGRWLLAVDAGSDEVSLFRVRAHALRFKDRIGSGGDDAAMKRATITASPDRSGTPRQRVTRGARPQARRNRRRRPGKTRFGASTSRPVGEEADAELALDLDVLAVRRRGARCRQPAELVAIMKNGTGAGCPPGDTAASSPSLRRRAGRHAPAAPGLGASAGERSAARDRSCPPAQFLAHHHVQLAGGVLADAGDEVRRLAVAQHKLAPRPGLPAGWLGSAAISELRVRPAGRWSTRG